MNQSLDMLLLTVDGETAAAVRSAVEPLAEKTAVSLCRDVAELKTRMSRSVSNPGSVVAMVDIDQDPKQILFDLSKIVPAFANVPCVIVSREFNEPLVLQAMQAGARHFLRKSSIATELASVLLNLLDHKSESLKRLGNVITVFSSGGGCGATTAAVNLAQELYLATSEPTLVVDLDEHYGSVGRHLGVEGHYGVGHMLARTGAIDKHLIQTSAIQSRDGLDVLLSPVAADSNGYDALHYEKLLPMLDACRESHAYVIVDAPRVPRRVMAELASVSRVAVVVFQLTVRDVALAKSTIAFLTEREMSRDRILPLANRTKKGGSLLRLEDSQRAIGTQSLCRVRSHWRKAVKSMNRGQPLAVTAPHSGLRRDYRRIAAQIKRQTTNGG